MAYVHQIDLSEIIIKLPDIKSIKLERDFSNVIDSLFLCALGFEDRCSYISQLIADKSNYKCDEAIYFEYSTNREDNEINRERLINSLSKFADLITPIECDAQEFSSTIRQIFLRLIKKDKNPTITFDISVCTSRLLLTVLKILFEFDINLRIVYSEAEIYHPKKEEVQGDSKIKEWISNEEFGPSRGISDVLFSREHSGYNIDRLPQAILAFAPFKPERTDAIISKIDETLFDLPEDRIIWIIGIPHHKKNYWRRNFLYNVNNISKNVPQHNISTFDYKQTLKLLEKLWKKNANKYHLNVSPLGSKMQSLGIALFHHLRPDVSIIFATPKEYNASHYSEGCRATWIVDFGELDRIRTLLNSVDTIKIKS